MLATQHLRSRGSRWALLALSLWLVLACDASQAQSPGFPDDRHVVIDDCVDPPGAPTLLSPADNYYHCAEPPVLFLWSLDDIWTRFNWQLDSEPSFSAPSQYFGSRASVGWGLELGTHFWRVRAQNECGWGSWSEVRRLIVDDFPGVPDLNTPLPGKQVCDTTPTFDWEGAERAGYYRIQVDDSSGFEAPEISSTTLVSRYTPSTPLERGRYFWRVRAGNGCGWGAWTMVGSFTIPYLPRTPDGPSPVDGAVRVPVQTDLGWEDAMYASAYDVYFGTSADPPFVGSSETSAYNLPRLSHSTRYYWRVVAKGTCGNTIGPLWAFVTAARHLVFLPMVVR